MLLIVFEPISNHGVVGSSISSSITDLGVVDSFVSLSITDLGVANSSSSLSKSIVVSPRCVIFGPSLFSLSSTLDCSLLPPRY